MQFLISAAICVALSILFQRFVCDNQRINIDFSPLFAFISFAVNKRSITPGNETQPISR
jgi:hypothetical protein